MPSQYTPSDFAADWAEIRDKLTLHGEVMDETLGRLSPENSERFTKLFLDYTSSSPPSVAEAQETLRSIFGDDTGLLSKYSPFLTHPASTPAECKAARDEYGKILHMPMQEPMLEPPPPREGWPIEEFLAADRLGEPALNSFVDHFNRDPRNRAYGIPTRPAMAELLVDDAELQHQFKLWWPIEHGDHWW